MKEKSGEREEREVVMREREVVGVGVVVGGRRVRREVRALLVDGVDTGGSEEGCC